VSKLGCIAMCVALALAPVGPAMAVTSADFVFDFVLDAGDNADGPAYVMTGVGPVDDGGGCDAVTMIMVDPSGTVVDIDPNCLSLADGTATDDADYGSNQASAVPACSPVTFALFDLTAADLTALSGISADADYVNYVRSNARLLREHTLIVTGLPSCRPFSFAPAPAAPVPVDSPAALVLIAAALALTGWLARKGVSSRES